MRITWSCTACTRTEKTSPSTNAISHLHGGIVYQLQPYKKPRRSPGEVTVKSLKKEVWDLFSEWVRRKDAVDGYAQCVTCGKRLLWQEMQAGHYKSRKHNNTFLNERNVHVQCPICNMWNHGEMVTYREFLINTYGENVIPTLDYLARLRHDFSIFELEQYKKHYTRRLEELK